MSKSFNNTNNRKNNSIQPQMASPTLLSDQLCKRVIYNFFISDFFKQKIQLFQTIPYFWQSIIHFISLQSPFLQQILHQTKYKSVVLKALYQIKHQDQYIGLDDERYDEKVFDYSRQIYNKLLLRQYSEKDSLLAAKLSEGNIQKAMKYINNNFKIEKIEIQLPTIEEQPYFLYNYVFSSKNQYLRNNIKKSYRYFQWHLMSIRYKYIQLFNIMVRNQKLCMKMLQYEDAEDIKYYRKMNEDETFFAYVKNLNWQIDDEQIVQTYYEHNRNKDKTIAVLSKKININVILDSDEQEHQQESEINSSFK